ncbi:tyrosine-type recombinase/integrase [Tumebacillus permanentifrigoris]|uniref:Integrase/recombinase XerC n=1 Tax=Tumebacillus permanentifrigoris TaxID=378543 RepID=A0A316D6U1_9BACL|nr:tyrosine-type recombinase/integrase [Tumebacillus permanentifrigoris]PWK09012.1 integrase/recombinase XerC [Tumebacillus permanentifrigoris]
MRYQDEFKTWLLEEDRGEKTIQTYLSVMQMFVKWFEQTEGVEFDLKQVTPIHIHDYRSYLANNLEQKPATINKAIATLKTFFGWAVEAKHIGSSPAAKVKMKRVQKNQSPKWLSENEQNRLLVVMDTEKNEFKQARDRAIIYTILKSGLRAEEITDLKLNHIDLRQGTVTVYSGKGGKFRIVPMNDELKKVLKVWLVFRNESQKPAHKESQYMFVTERSGKMTVRALNYMLDVYLERCGLLERSVGGDKLEGQFSCHSLRHSFCHDLACKGVPIEQIKELAGHDSIQTTAIYVQASTHDLRKSVNKI